ncbi:MAG: hypothetical protein HOW73_08085 [Polyangiaceae bacterium]|nr:hypothetical protein [Polyangiaceae bacterium]
MNKKLALAISGLAVVAVAVAAGATALAGTKIPGPVQIHFGEKWAQGSMGYARSTSDNVTQIGCQVQVVDLGEPAMNCVARDSAGNAIICSTEDPYMISIMGAMNSDSYIHFEWDANKTCTTLYVATNSAYQPK